MKRGLVIILLVFLSLSPSAKAQDTNNVFKPHSPRKATLLSTFLPGAGQVYNKQTWKVPIVYAGLGTAAGFAIYNYQGAEKFKKEYLLRANGIEEGRNPQYANYPDQSIYNLYFAYEKNFELSIFIGIGVYLLNIVDAMVYGHLFEFDISDNISLNLKPYYIPMSLGQYTTSIPKTSTIGLNLKLSF